MYVIFILINFILKNNLRAIFEDNSLYYYIFNMHTYIHIYIFNDNFIPIIMWYIFYFKYF